MGDAVMDDSFRLTPRARTPPYFLKPCVQIVLATSSSNICCETYHPLDVEKRPSNARTYLNIVTHNTGNANIGVKMYGEGFRLLVHSFVRLSTKNVILPLGELLQKMANPVNTRVLYFRNS